MSRAQLKINNFGTSILTDYALFSHKVRKLKNLGDKGKVLVFDWEWNGYSGYGHLCFTNKIDIVEGCGAYNSQLTVSGKSRRQQQNGRNTCSLYNDKSLMRIFVDMLDKFGNNPPTDIKIETY